jgi:hypothetical protein
VVWEVYIGVGRVSGRGWRQVRIVLVPHGGRGVSPHGRRRYFISSGSLDLPSPKGRNGACPVPKRQQFP